MDLSQPMAPELTSLRLTSMMDDLPEEGNGPCCNCTMSSAKWVMHHVVEHIKAKCEETECPKLKAMCEKAKEHPKVTFGFLLAAVRPLSLGYAWCNGKGECGKNSSLESLPTTDDEMSAIDAVSSLYTSVEYDMEPEDDESVAFDLADQAEEVFDNEMRPPCKMCVKSVTKGVMFHVIGKITKYCFKTEDPKIKKMVSCCMWNDVFRNSACAGLIISSASLDFLCSLLWSCSASLLPCTSSSPLATSSTRSAPLSSPRVSAWARGSATILPATVRRCCLRLSMTAA
mmetsp:Transcript_35899/g.101662  ORF Transcript_35899/g.101662 Transcript_35899/m.101662 type:complete len:286 (+) Transcript_35899:755-1612(+)